MELSDIRKRINDLEQLIFDEVESLEQETGVCVTDIQLNRLDISSKGSNRYDSIIQNVTCKVDL